MATVHPRENFVWARRILLAEVALAVACAAYSLIHYPVLPANGAIQLFTGIGALLLGVYAFFVLTETRNLSTQAAQIGRHAIGCGLVILALFLLKTFGAVAIDRGIPLPRFLLMDSNTFLTAAGLVALLGGVLVSWRTDTFAAGAQLGARTAMIAGISIAVVLLGATIVLAPLAAHDAQLASEIAVFAIPIQIGDGESAMAADGLLQAVAILIFVPIFTIVGGIFGEVLGAVLARVGILGRDEARRGRISAQLGAARMLIQQGRLRAAVNDLGTVLEQWLQTMSRLRADEAPRRDAPRGSEPFSMQGAVEELRAARSLTHTDVDDLEYAIHLREDVAGQGREPSRDEVEKMLAVVQRVAEQKVGFAS